METKESKNNNGLNIIITAVIIAIIIFAGNFIYDRYYSISQQPQNQSQNQEAINSTAKIQTDSAVKTDPTANWKVVKNEKLGFELKYPNNFFDQDHEPKLYMGNCSFGDCRDVGEVVGGVLGIPSWQNANGKKFTINNAEYLSCRSSDSGAGHTYNYYYYITTKNDTCLVINFDTNITDCDFYLPLEQGNTEQSKSYDDCVATNENRPEILSQIVNTFTIK